MKSEQKNLVIIVPTVEELQRYPALADRWQRRPEASPWEAYQGKVGKRTVTWLLSDCGPVNAGAAAERAILQFRAEIVLHGGAAGAHDPSLRPGDLVVGQKYVVLVPPAFQAARRARGLHPKQIRFRRGGRRVHLDHDAADPWLVDLAARGAAAEQARLGPWPGPGWPPNEPPRPGRVVIGSIGSTDLWHTDPAEIAAYRREYETACEDMESAFIAQVCAMHSIPFLAVRAISNHETVCPIPPEAIPSAIAEAGARAAAVLAWLAGMI